MLVQRTKKRIMSRKDFHFMPSLESERRSKVGNVFQFYKLEGEARYIAVYSRTSPTYFTMYASINL